MRSERAIIASGVVRAVMHVQAILYITTGLWPVVHLPSFEWITGEKYDDFLVRTVGLLLFVTGGVLLNALRRHRITPETLWLAAGSAASLCIIDVAYYLNGRLPAIYLLDAVVEAVFAVSALYGLRMNAASR